MATGKLVNIATANNYVKYAIWYSSTGSNVYAEIKGIYRTTSGYTTYDSTTTAILKIDGVEVARKTGTNFSLNSQGTGVSFDNIDNYVVMLSGSRTVTKSNPVISIDIYGSQQNAFHTSGGGHITASLTASADVATAPSGLALSVTGRSYNSITANTTVGNWGTGGSKTYRVFKVLQEKYEAGKSALGKGSTSSSTGAVSITVSNSSHDDDVGTVFTIKGASKYYIGLYADNGAKDERYAVDTQYSTPPAPLASITHSSTGSATANSTTHTVKITGGDTSVNSTNAVTTQYRYSTDNGSNWSSWASISGTASPQTAKSFTFTSVYGASCKVEARQVYDSQNSEVKSYSFTAPNCTVPSGGSVSVVSKTWNSVTLKGTLSTYGSPVVSGSTDYVLGVHKTAGDTTYKRQNSIKTGVTTWQTTVNNSSTYPGGSAITIQGCMTLYPYGWASNGVCSAYVPQSASTLSVTTPPAPLSTMAVSSQSIMDNHQIQAKIDITGSSTNNVSGQKVKTQYRYSTDNGSTYSSWTDASGTAIDPSTKVTVTIQGLPQNRNIKVQARQYQTTDSYSESKELAFVSLQDKPQLNYSWNDTRTVLTLDGNGSSSASAVEILYGYTSSGKTSLKRATGDTVTATVSDPNHGQGQVLYFTLRAEYVDGTTEDATEVSVPVPNPIIGVLINPDGSKKYIVDIVEKKKNGTVTKKWQNGRRVVKK